MGKKGSSSELWDDSALLDAFDHAMDTFKDMRTRRDDGGSHGEENTAVSDEKDRLPTEKRTRHIKPEDDDNIIPNETTDASVHDKDTEAATEDLSGQETQFGANLNASESDHPHSSGLPHADGNGYGYSDQQNMEYEQLLKQYYELEEQKQRVVQQLNQTNYWNYQTPVQSSTYQTNQVSADNTFAQGLNNPCSLCSCQCISVPLVPTSACVIGGMPGGCYSSCPSLMAYCSGAQSHEVPCGSHVPVGNDSAVKTGMLAAEKAINSMKLEIGAASNSCGEKEKGEKSSGILEGNLSQAVSSGSDFTAVLKAWYLAGLHTGRQDFICIWQSSPRKTINNNINIDINASCISDKILSKQKVIVPIILIVVYMQGASNSFLRWQLERCAYLLSKCC
ncbi:uncharacterized protein M6B38_153560 [Iris pallida]|uniref:Survival Motor Neuron Gemin2-binding domain-containing protein n=1 Tax=Iris pallida TaxID=29817 RepID=A0AAX6F5T7_IRIPA|nr:uncharacterized protein M6B38_153560 [Iris pallida]